ncbi:unnamed protein product [Brachionus calyciflorus]|uniref:Integrase catalytic domain-containing protein n=1 Tax=Brachionus calyciflorus TaxID=104777 RepID=A0A814L8N9_9BILA|nr:unnamed protein product [Brachionus calyciflorus]
MAGPFPKSKRGNIYILVMVCAFTKLSRAIPLPLSTADMISDAIISSWICLYSIPEYILSDRGKNFQSMLLELIYEKLDIKQLRTTAYHPECDGQSERFIRTLKAMIRGYVAENQQNWDENIEKLTFAYNTAEHSTTGYSPHEMVFGEPPRIPLDLVFDLSEEVNKHQEFDYPNLQILFDHEDDINPKIDPFVKNYCESKIKQLKNIYSKAMENGDLVMNKAKIRHDRNIRKFEYEVGDLVLTDHVQLKKGLSSGLAHKYHGPFEIMAKHPNKVNYVIRRVNQKRSKQFLIHKNRLKKYFGHFNEGQNIAANQSIIDEKSVLIPPNDSIVQIEPQVRKQTVKKPKTDRASLKILEIIEESGEENLKEKVIEVIGEESSLESADQNDYSFRPYYNKKTNREYKRANQNIENSVRSSTRSRKAPDRYKA